MSSGRGDAESEKILQLLLRGENKYGKVDAERRRHAVPGDSENHMIQCIFLDDITPEMEKIMREESPRSIQLSFQSEMTEAEKKAHFQKADAFLTATYKVDEALMKQSPRLKIIQKMGVGIDNIDAAAAASMGIAVRNVPGGNANSVAELTIGLMIDVYRKVSWLDQMSRRGEWGTWTYRYVSYELKDKVHGIVGFGDIGKRVAALSGAFGTRLLYYSRTRAEPAVEKQYNIEYAPLAQVLALSDIVSLHLPLTPATKDLIAAEELAMMKRDAVLINVGRGGVVNEGDLYQALSGGKLLGAAIDVWEREPFDRQNPLLRLDNIVATPHIGGGTVDAAQNIFRKSFKNILAAC